MDVELLTTKELHRYAMTLFDNAWSIQSGRAYGSIEDAVKLYRKALHFERQAYVKARDKHSKKILWISYKSIQSRIRKLTW